MKQDPHIEIKNVDFQVFQNSLDKNYWAMIYLLTPIYYKMYIYKKTFRSEGLLYFLL